MRMLHPRWRVARMKKGALGGVESPHTMYWTKRGAFSAALQLNELHDRTGVSKSIFSVMQGETGQHRWIAIRGRTLRGLQSFNIVQEQRAARQLAEKIENAVINPEARVKRARPTRQDRVSLCAAVGECAGPWNMNGNCVHCGRLAPGLVREERNDEGNDAGDPAVPAPDVAASAAPVGSDADDDQRTGDPAGSEVHVEAGSEVVRAGDEPARDDAR